jgi:hypothetical protein
MNRFNSKIARKMTTMRDEKQEISRREVLIGAGTIAAGAAVLSTGVTSFVSNAKASTANYKYKKLDINEVGRIAHETYFTKFCAETVMTSLFKPLAASVGEPYASFPLDSMFWAHGGMMGWGTACGTLIGAGTAIGLITSGDKTKVTTAGGRAPVPVGEAIINDVIAFYASEALPQYRPETGQAKYEVKNQSVSDTPICHISVGKWMKKEDVKFFGIERKERCARLAADVAMYTAKLLNEWADGTYKPRNEPLANALDNQITSQNNCTDCHGDNVPTAKGA